MTSLEIFGDGLVDNTSTGSTGEVVRLGELAWGLEKQVSELQQKAELAQKAVEKSQQEQRDTLNIRVCLKIVYP